MNKGYMGIVRLKTRNRDEDGTLVDVGVRVNDIKMISKRPDTQDTKCNIILKGIGTMTFEHPFEEAMSIWQAGLDAE